ncbi:PH domain-containing protein [Flavobacterium sp. AG291]|uniref:PH domain-containing protein n=1 Tax=Flavobacterium sp. AG291 TaxID=2184000 RepID=UPI000E0A73E9|nr:PH domain-containing protein [Flavobacterium sp. AG291]RDI14345.1 putative membrane protein [Flavobacterium sp. AG291]
MNNDFSNPQRQSLIGVLIMFADTLQSAIRALFPILIVWIIKIDQMNKIYLTIGILAVFVLVAVIAYLKYINFTFYLDEENEEFVIKRGIINKSRLGIPLDKIQQVNINQSFLQKIIGVHALEVDTAGTAQKEVTIKAITHDLAQSLKSRLLEGIKTTSDNSKVETESYDTVAKHAFIQISLLSLFKTGITSNYVRSFGILLAFFITMFQYIEDFIKYAEIEDDPLDNYLRTDVILKFIMFIILAIMAMVIVVNLGRTILKFFNFRITKQNDSLLLSHGLLNTKNTIIKPEKVQIVTVGRNYFQKKLDVLDIKIRQASSQEANNQDNKKTAIEIPGCNTAEKDMLLKFLLHEIPQEGIVLKPNIRKILMQSIKFLIIPLGAYFLLANYAFTELKEYMLFLPVYILFISLVMYFGFRNSRLFVNNEFIIKQGGAWDVDKDYIAPHKIHAISVHQYFWHKGLDIGILNLYTAGGKISFGLADYTTLKQFVNYWLYQVETTNKNWM